MDFPIHLLVSERIAATRKEDKDRLPECQIRDTSDLGGWIML